MVTKDIVCIVAIGSALGFLLSWGLDRQLQAMGY